MRTLSLVTSFLISCVVPVVFGHSEYVPGSACVDLFPAGHKDATGNKAYSQTTTSPYVVSVNPNTYTAGSTVEIVISANGLHGIDFFEGILLQVRRADCSHDARDEPLGTFELGTNEDFLTLMNCVNIQDTVGHKAHEHIYNRTFVWKAPPAPTGHVYVKATIARRQRTFWTNINSEFIRYQHDQGSTSDPEHCVVEAATTCSAPNNTSSLLLMISLGIFGILRYYS